jgi:hypothetical protein
MLSISFEIVKLFADIQFDWKADLKFRSAAGSAFDFDFSAVSGNNSIHNCQPKPCALSFTFGREEWDEYILPDIFAHTDPRVFNSQDCEHLLQGCGYDQPSTIRHCLEGIHNKVDNHLSQLNGIAPNLG